MFLTIFNRISIFHRRKSALPKYDPPYAKRQMLKGYSHPNSPHPSQHLTPDHTFEDAGKLECHLSCTLGHHHWTFVANVGHYCCIVVNKFVGNVDGLAELAGLDGEETSWRNTIKYYGFIVGTLPGFDFTAPAILA